jgi:hypothetical protein
MRSTVQPHLGILRGGYVAAAGEERAAFLHALGVRRARQRTGAHGRSGDGGRGLIVIVSVSGGGGGGRRLVVSVGCRGRCKHKGGSGGEEESPASPPLLLVLVVVVLLPLGVYILCRAVLVIVTVRSDCCNASTSTGL